MCPARLFYCRPGREGENRSYRRVKPEGSPHRREIKRIWTHRRLPAGSGGESDPGLERRAVLASTAISTLTTGFRQPEAVKLYLSQGYEARFDLTRDGRVQSARHYDGRLRFH